ncbi:hypothetical protein Tco_0985207 [Tanacetum coccineum]
MVERSGGRGVTVVEERCGGGGVIVGMERPKTEVAGLPPQEWHEAAFTRIARIRGEVIFPEKYHFGDNDDEADNGNQGDKDHGEDMEDEDDIFDDGSECDIFLHQDFDNYQGEGGWIRDEVSDKDIGEHHDKDSPEKGMVDDTLEYSNTPVDLECHMNLPASPKYNWVCQSPTQSSKKTNISDQGRMHSFCQKQCLVAVFAVTGGCLVAVLLSKGCLVAVFIIKGCLVAVFAVKTGLRRSHDATDLKRERSEGKKREKKNWLWQDTYQNRRPTQRCGKLEKDGDKAMNEENERRLRMHLFPLGNFKAYNDSKVNLRHDNILSKQLMTGGLTGSRLFEVYASELLSQFKGKTANIRSERTHRAPERLCLNVEVEEHSLRDLNEPTSYKAAMLDSESDK